MSLGSAPLHDFVHGTDGQRGSGNVRAERGQGGPSRALSPQPPQAASTNQLVDPSQLAVILGVSRCWVYEHATQLGAMRLGSGKKARLRFDPVAAREVLSCWGSRQSPSENPSNGGDSQPSQARRGGRRPQRRPQPGQILVPRPRRTVPNAH